LTCFINSDILEICKAALQISRFIWIELILLKKLIIIYPGEKDFMLDKKIHVMNLKNFLTLSAL